MTAKISPTMSIGRRIPIDSFAGNINIKTVTTNIPELGKPDLENPIKIAHKTTMTQEINESSKINIPLFLYKIRSNIDYFTTFNFFLKFNDSWSMGFFSSFK